MPAKFALLLALICALVQTSLILGSTDADGNVKHVGLRGAIANFVQVTSDIFSRKLSALKLSSQKISFTPNPTFDGYLAEGIGYVSDCEFPPISAGGSSLWKLGYCSKVNNSKLSHRTGVQFGDGGWLEYDAVYASSKCHNSHLVESQSSVNVHLSQCNTKHSNYGFSIITYPLPSDFKLPPNYGNVLKLDIYADSKCGVEIGVKYTSADNQCIPNGLDYQSLIKGGYKQGCSVDPATGAIVNPYTNYADEKCTKELSAFPANKFLAGCRPWIESGVETGDASWYFKASCVKT